MAGSRFQVVRHISNLKNPFRPVMFVTGVERKVKFCYVSVLRSSFDRLLQDIGSKIVQQIATEILTIDHA